MESAPCARGISLPPNCRNTQEGHSRRNTIYLSRLILIYEMPRQWNTTCIDEFLRFGDLTEDGLLHSENPRWSRLLAGGCYHETPLGRVAQWDGLLIFDNPNFVDANKKFSLSDTILVTKDLRTDVRGIKKASS